MEYRRESTTAYQHKVAMLEKFKAKRREILNRLSKPDKDYADASPKGSVDEEIRELVEKINTISGFVTTSSCAGRIAVYVEGPQKHIDSSTLDTGAESVNLSITNNNLTASAGGKGGGRWLFSSHVPLNLESLLEPGKVFELLGFASEAVITLPSPNETPQFVHFKFEPMVRSYTMSHLTS